MMLAGEGPLLTNAEPCKCPDSHVNAWLVTLPLGIKVCHENTDSTMACENIEGVHTGEG